MAKSLQHARVPRGVLLVLTSWLGLAGVLPAAAQTATASEAPSFGALTGEVTTASGEPVEGAEVSLVDLRRRTRTSADGSFRLEGLPAGSYLLEARSLEHGEGSARVEVRPGAEASVQILVDLARLHDEVVVTAGASARQQLELAQASTVLSGDDLDQRRDSTLGETLAQQPGISSTYFGPGASRPVIRGLGGDRVRMLSDGLGSADASNVSPDHAVSVDPASAERIEVLRGPSTLLYGSTAIGGVVNVLDNRIPGYAPEKPLTGSVELSAGTVAGERQGSLMLEGGAGRFAWHADYLQRETDDYEIPGFAEADPQEDEEMTGELDNSALDSEAGSIGFSLVGDTGLIGLSVSGFDTLYGVPGHEHEHEEKEEGGPVRIDLEQRRVDLKGELRRPFGLWSGARLRLGSADYEHRELEGAEVGTTFLNESLEGRFELVQQRTRGGLSGSVGVQYSTSDFAAIGAEAFVPPSTTDLAAVFAFEEIQRGKLRYQFGGRFENQQVDVDSELPDRDLSGLSGSLGLVWEPADDYSLSVSVARSVRLPTATELYANGPHIATDAFEVGDPDLDQETSLGVDVSLRKRTGRFTATLNLFANRFDDYVFERFNGEEQDGLAVIVFDQQDAEFVGGEIEGLVNLYQGDHAHFDLLLGTDYVRAELSGTGEPLPRIPPRRHKLGVSYRYDRLRAFAEAIRAESQDRASDEETTTAGYTLLNAGISYRLFLGPTVLDLMLRGRNLGDEEARNHVSFLKDVAPLPGRDVNLGVRLAF